MARKSLRDIERIWTNVEGIKKLSDRAIPLGPFGIGLDGILTWIPGVGGLYSVVVAVWLMAQGVRARAAPATLARMAFYLGIDTVASEATIVGSAIDFFWQGHLMAAKALQRDIETTHWVETSAREAHESGAHAQHLETVRRDPALRRIVYLHD